jgi:hypothetical protein
MDGVSFIATSYPKHNHHRRTTINNHSLAQHIKQTTIRIPTTCQHIDNAANTLPIVQLDVGDLTKHHITTSNMGSPFSISAHDSSFALLLH